MCVYVCICLESTGKASIEQLCHSCDCYVDHWNVKSESEESNLRANNLENMTLWLKQNVKFDCFFSDLHTDV